MMKKWYKILSVLVLPLVNFGQQANFSGIPIDEIVCETSADILLTGDNDLTGTFSGNGITDNGDGTAYFSPVDAGSGTHSITYNLSYKFLEVSAGTDYILTIRDDGTLWGWGKNNSGQLGDGTNEDRSTPIQIGTDNDWIKVAAGSSPSIGLKSDGTIWTWGMGGILTPQKVGTDEDWKDGLSK